MMGDTHLPQTGHDAVLLSDRAREEHPRSWRLFPDVAGLHGPPQDPVAAAAASRRSTSRRCPRDAHGGFHESRLQQQRLQRLRILQPRPADPAGLLRILPTKRRDAGGVHESQTESPRRPDPLPDPEELCVSVLLRHRRLGAHPPLLSAEKHTGDRRRVNQRTVNSVRLCSTFVVKMCSKTKKSCLHVNGWNVFLWFISK